LLASTAQVEQQRGHGLQLVDARPSSYFAGSAKSDKAPRAGTIPGALNLPQQDFLQQGDDTDGGDAWFFDARKVSALVDQSGLATDEPVATFCNTGTLASVDWFALSEVAGMRNVRLYDGGMVAWTTDQTLPVQIGEQGEKRIVDPAEM